MDTQISQPLAHFDQASNQLRDTSRTDVHHTSLALDAQAPEDIARIPEGAALEALAPEDVAQHLEGVNLDAQAPEDMAQHPEGAVLEAQPTERAEAALGDGSFGLPLDDASDLPPAMTSSPMFGASAGQLPPASAIATSPPAPLPTASIPESAPASLPAFPVPASTLNSMPASLPAPPLPALFAPASLPAPPLPALFAPASTQLTASALGKHPALSQGATQPPYKRRRVEIQPLDKQLYVPSNDSAWCRPWADLPAQTRDALEAYMTRMISGSDAHSYKYGVMTSNPGKYIGKGCVGNNVFSRSSKIKFTGDSTDEACYTCVQKHRPCARITQSIGPPKLNFYPLPARHRQGMTWTDAAFWVLPSPPARATSP